MDFFPAESEGALAPNERLALRGRLPNHVFGESELLYYRVPEFDNLGFVPSAAIKYPSNDGISFNRSSFSLAHDVLWPEWPHWHVTMIPVHLACHSEKSGDTPPREYRLKPYHDPLDHKSKYGENYAHTLIQTTLTGQLEDHLARVPNRVKTGMKMFLCQHLRPVNLG